MALYSPFDVPILDNILSNKKGKKHTHHNTVLQDYWLALVSRELSLQSRREVLTGKAKFGIFGDGKEVPVEATAFIIDLDDCKFVANIHRDISHRKKAEAQLKESERRYRLIMDNAVDAIFLNDVEHGHLLDFIEGLSQHVLRRLIGIDNLGRFDII